MGQEKENSATFRTNKYILVLSFIWLLITLGSLFWNILSIDYHIKEIAKAEARTSFNKDLAIRMWATEHGGIYVPMNDRTPANPYLSHIPDREIIRENGDTLTLMNPAYMIRQMHDEFPKEYGIVGRIVSLQPLNPNNSPDEWERKTLLSFEEKEKENFEFYKNDGEEYLRLMQPLIAQKGCLKCHFNQGYKVGSVVGGIGVSIAMLPLYQTADSRKNTLILFHILFQFIGFIGIWFSTRRFSLVSIEKKRTLRLLKGAESRFKNVADYTYDWEYWERPDKSLEYVSPSCKRISGYSAKEFLDNPQLLEDIILEEDRMIFRDHHKHSYATRDLCEIQFRINRKDGHIIWIEHVCQTTFDDEGNFLGHRGSNSNISLRKHAEEETKKNYEQQKLVSEVSFLFTKLGNFNKNMNDVLSLIGKYTGVSRVYLFEDFNNGELTKNTFEWCNTNIEPQIGDLQKIPYQIIPSWKKLLFKNGMVLSSNIFELPQDLIDILEPQGIKSIFVLPIYVDKQFTGFMGFDDCENKRVWTKSEIELLKTVTNIIATFFKRQQFEKELRKLSQATEQSPASVVITNSLGDIEYVNKKFSEISGYSFKEVIGKNTRILRSGNHTEQFYEELWDTVLSGNNWRGEIENKKKNGELFWELALLSPIVNDDGDITSIVAIKKDITEIRKTQAVLKESEERYRVTAEATGDVFYRLNYKNMDYEYIHPNIEKLTGYKKEELNLRDILIKIERNGKIVELDEIANVNRESNDFYFSADYLIKTKSGEKKWLSDRSYPLLKEDGKVTGRYGMLIDITSRKNLEYDLIIARENAEEADKMKSLFLSQMSHEIRTPINVMLGMSSLLKDDFEKSSNEDQLMSFNIIAEEGKRIIKTTDLLLNFSELETCSFETFSTNINLYSDILSTIVANSREYAEGKKIKLSLNSSIANTGIKADLYSTTQIFLQLIDNAIKFTEKGEIKVEVFRNKKKQIVVEIIDTGIGITEEYLPKIFIPFTQEDMGFTRKYDGNGIGLALVKRYCELNNIVIEVESKKNIGSTFRVVF